MALGYELGDKWVRELTGLGPHVTLHFHHIKWGLFNLNKAVAWQCQRNRVDRQGKGREVGADFRSAATNLVGKASEQSMWLKGDRSKMKENQESDFF